MKNHPCQRGLRASTMENRTSKTRNTDALYEMTENVASCTGSAWCCSKWGLNIERGVELRPHSNPGDIHLQNAIFIAFYNIKCFIK